MRTHHLRGSIQIAVIGGNGFLGRAIIHRLSGFANLRIFSIDKRINNVLIDTSKFKAIVEQVQMDISGAGAIQSFLVGRPVDVVIFAAGVENPTDGLSTTFPEDLACLEGLAHTLSALPDMDLDEGETRPYFLYISSYSVYGSSKKLLTTESKEYPSNYTGMGKLMAEDLVKRNCTKYEVPFSILRPTEVYGRRHTRELRNRVFWPGFLPYYVDKFVKRDPQIEVFSPEVELDLVNVNHFSKVVEYLIEHQLEGTFNVASGTRIKLIDLVKKIASHYGQTESNIVTSQRLKVDHMKVDPGELQTLVPYDFDKYNLDQFILDYIPVRRYEIGKDMAIEDAISEPVLLDSSAFGAKEAYEARRLRRRLAYEKIHTIAGDEFFKIKIGRLQERYQELLSEPVKTELLEQASKEQEKNNGRLNLAGSPKEDRESPAPPKKTKRKNAKLPAS